MLMAIARRRFTGINRTVMSDNPSSVVFRPNGEFWLIGAREVVEGIGAPLFAAFLKCFNGSDRLLTLEHFVVQTMELPEDSLHQRRNLRLLGFYLASTMSESGEALQELCNAQVVTKMTNRNLWNPLNAWRARWQGDGLVRRFRNTFGFHLGPVSLYEAGVSKMLDESNDLLFARLDRPRRHDGEFVLGHDALFRGFDLQSEDLERIVAMANEAHTNLPDALMAAWIDVLETAGIEIEQA